MLVGSHILAPGCSDMAIARMAYVHARHRCRQVGHFGRATGTLKTDMVF